MQMSVLKQPRYVPPLMPKSERRKRRLLVHSLYTLMNRKDCLPEAVSDERDENRLQKNGPHNVRPPKNDGTVL